jgi:hypothetical protein
MARASSVYAVFKGNVPLAAFTVRHELVTWIKAWQPEYLDLMTVYKFPDGDHFNHYTKENDSFEPFEVDIVQLLIEK